MKKLLTPIIALLAFSMLSTSISAGMPYYMTAFYAEASGSCLVSEAPTPLVPGKGYVHVRGSAICIESGDFYVAGEIFDVNTRLWTRRSRLTASWNNKKLTVWMWPSYTVYGVFNDTLNRFYVFNMTYFGCYMGDAGLQFVSGRADVICEVSPTQYLVVNLYRGTAPWVIFYWFGAEYLDYPVARHFVRRVTVWGPIPWHPSGP